MLGRECRKLLKDGGMQAIYPLVEMPQKIRRVYGADRDQAELRRFDWPGFHAEENAVAG